MFQRRNLIHLQLAPYNLMEVLSQVTLDLQLAALDQLREAPNLTLLELQ
jgi:hypothetical protein